MGGISYLTEHCIKARLASKSEMQDLNLSKRALSWLRRPCERGTASESTPFLFALLSVIPMSCTHTTCWHSRYHLKGSKSLHTIPQFACCEVPLKSQAEYQAASILYIASALIMLTSRQARDYRGDCRACFKPSMPAHTVQRP